MKIGFGKIAYVSLVAALLVTSGCGKKATGQVVAVVNGDEITLDELNAELNNVNLPPSADKKLAMRQLLQQVIDRRLLAQTAKEQGAGEAWFVDPDGLVTEGASSNAWIVDKDGVLRTRDTTANILRGVTRKTVMGLLGEVNIRLDERAFTPEEVRSAREAFITGAGALIMPVVGIDGVPIGDGKPGPVAQRLRALYIENAQASIS